MKKDFQISKIISEQNPTFSKEDTPKLSPEDLKKFADFFSILMQIDKRITKGEKNMKQQ